MEKDRDQMQTQNQTTITASYPSYCCFSAVVHLLIVCSDVKKHGAAAGKHRKIDIRIKVFVDEYLTDKNDVYYIFHSSKCSTRKKEETKTTR